MTKLTGIDKFVIERVIDTAMAEVTAQLLAEYKGLRGSFKAVDSGMNFAHERGLEASQSIENYFKNKGKKNEINNNTSIKQ